MSPLVPHPSDDDGLSARVAELVSAAPDLTPDQVLSLRLLIHGSGIAASARVQERAS
jgi:hypothetical protein